MSSFLRELPQYIFGHLATGMSLCSISCHGDLHTSQVYTNCDQESPLVCEQFRQCLPRAWKTIGASAHHLSTKTTQENGNWLKKPLHPLEALQPKLILFHKQQLHCGQFLLHKKMWYQMPFQRYQKDYPADLQVNPDCS